MKKILSLALIVAALIGCKPDGYKDIGPSYDLTTGIDGSWQISEVEITDLTLPVPEGRDISEFYTKTNPLKINFDAVAGTYMVVNPEVKGNNFGTQGTFRFNDPEFPSAVMLITAENDTLNMDLTNMVRSIDPKMGLKLTRSRCGEDYVSYSYTFNRK